MRAGWVLLWLLLLQPAVADEASDIIRTIDLNQPPASLALDISEALGRGEWIGLLSDRSTRDERTAHFDFLGDPARFPLGPCIVAGMFKVPLICVFPLYVDGGYEVHCEIISAAADMPRDRRDEALRKYVGTFVSSLEKYVRQEPYNWFNFFDFWGRS